MTRPAPVPRKLHRLDQPLPPARSGALELAQLSSVHWGAGCIASLAGVLNGFGATRILVITNRSLATTPLLERLRQATGQRVHAVHEVPAHVPHDRVADLSAELSRLAGGVQAVISFGGGSSIDAAKAVLAGTTQPALHIAVPTNLSGAELSSGFGVTEQRPDGPFKQSFRDPAVSPAVVFYDPDMTTTTPPHLWAASGVKALDHAVEGLLNSPALPVVSALAVTGIRSLTEILAASVTNTALRAQAQLAAWQCYFAPANFRYGLSHRLGHILGGTFGLAHSATSAVTLAPVVRATAHAQPAVTAAIAAALDPSTDSTADASPAQTAGHAADLLEQLVTELELPRRLSQLGLHARSDLETIERLLHVHYPETIASFKSEGQGELREWLNDLW
jgi:maleylacetate reductase